MALLLAAVGVYAVMGYTVTQRNHEIGVRMALGANPGDVRAMVVRDGLRLALVGTALGVAARWRWRAVLQAVLHGVERQRSGDVRDRRAVLLAVAAGGLVFPARPATRVDPMVVLRDASSGRLGRRSGRPGAGRAVESRRP